jgi:hypothetical protein
VLVDDDVAIDVIDVRVVDQRVVLDLAVRVDGLVVWLPGPGRPSPGWTPAISQERTVLRLPSTATAWLRDGPPQPWLMLVGQSPRLTAADLGDRMLLDQREFGAVEFVLTDGELDVRAERCDSGSGCRVAIPATVSDDRQVPPGNPIGSARPRTRRRPVRGVSSLEDSRRVAAYFGCDPSSDRTDHHGGGEQLRLLAGAAGQPLHCHADAGASNTVAKPGGGADASSEPDSSAIPGVLGEELPHDRDVERAGRLCWRHQLRHDIPAVLLVPGDAT